ncbi:MAG: flagellar basal body P-ring formation chaperone FlgA [Synergistaceae bacterium]|jgi:flagella basal body P-ring formation protein FlgA|nr:flagellar basal body P-ring formation chaperone FlgA [Synergistaceae bacterium]
MKAHSFIIITILTAAFSAFLPRPARAAELTISLPPSVEAREGWFYLGEYAEIYGDRETADGASMAVIRHDGSFSRRDVIDALSYTEAAGREVSIVMPDVVEVDAEPEIAAELRAMTAWKWRVEIDVAPGSWAETINGFSGYRLPPKITPGARSIAVKLVDADGREHNKQVKATWYQPVIYATRPLSRGERIDVSKLGARIGKAAMMMTGFSSPEQLAGAVTRKAVNALVQLETGDVRQESFIRAGSTVTMVARSNGLGVEVKGIAMQRGGLGDIIRVKNLSSKKILKARIIGADRVEINTEAAR